jgi:hypothetical protein
MLLFGEIGKLRVDHRTARVIMCRQRAVCGSAQAIAVAPGDLRAAADSQPRRLKLWMVARFTVALSTVGSDSARPPCSTATRSPMVRLARLHVTAAQFQKLRIEKLRLTFTSAARMILLCRTRAIASWNCVTTPNSPRRRWPAGSAFPPGASPHGRVAQRYPDEPMSGGSRRLSGFGLMISV